MKTANPRVPLGVFLVVIVAFLSFGGEVDKYIYDAVSKVVAVGGKLHGYLTATERDRDTGRITQTFKTTYYGPQDTYYTVSIKSHFTDPVIIERYSNPNAPDGRDVVTETKTTRWQRRDGTMGGYTDMWYAAGGFQRTFQFELGYEVPLPTFDSPTAPIDGLLFDGMSRSWNSIEVEATPKFVIYTLSDNPTNSQDPGGACDAALTRLQGAAEAFTQDLQGIVSLAAHAANPMYAIGVAETIYDSAVNWQQTLENVRATMQNTAEDYWYSRLGLIDDSVHYKMEGQLGYYTASTLIGGWITRPVSVARATYNVPSSLLVGPASKHVYLGWRNGTPVYVGMTSDMIRRQYQHGSRFVINAITDLNEPMTERMARGIEQALIERARSQGWNFENKINSISPSQPYYQDALTFGNNWLNAHPGALP